MSSSLLAVVTSVALMTGAVAPAHAAPAGKASVLTLEGDDPAKTSGLSKALQSEFAARGVGGGRDMSLAELKLTMGCDEPPSVACLSGGGKTLGVDRMIYGTLTKTRGGAYSLNLSLMNVSTATVEKIVNAELAEGALAAGTVKGTATDLVTQMLGPVESATPEVVPEPEPVTGPETGPKENGKLIWGKYDAPGWKKAALGASAGLLVVSLAVGIGTWVQIKPNGKLYKDLVAAGERSLGDESGTNNVNPNMKGDMCEEARSAVKGGVKNGEMTKICNKADGLATAATGAFVATGVFAVATVAFATLLFVHKNKPGVARLQRHGVTMGMAPMRGGGAMLGGSLRF
ncbi:MAG: hypothetical protein H0T76_05095 [Nannocystis sp.]|nr:hypothetical protein [Nannocystis sp.]MBA3545841.1 hypothetical protein [Nannocystis sp.]